MSDVADFIEIKENKKKNKEFRKLNAAASHAILDNCLKFLEMNKLDELDDLKIIIKKKLKILMDIKNG
jgi:hypothetical protein